jgi:hypothetical protein
MRRVTLRVLAPVERLPTGLIRPLFRWEVKTDESEGVRWLTKQQAVAYALGLSDGGAECAVTGSRSRCFYFPSGAFSAARGTQ